MSASRAADRALWRSKMHHEDDSEDELSDDELDMFLASDQGIAQLEALRNPSLPSQTATSSSSSLSSSSSTPGHISHTQSHDSSPLNPSSRAGPNPSANTLSALQQENAELKKQIEIALAQKQKAQVEVEKLGAAATSAHDHVKRLSATAVAERVRLAEEEALYANDQMKALEEKMKEMAARIQRESAAALKAAHGALKGKQGIATFKHRPDQFRVIDLGVLHNLLLAASLFDEGAASREKKRILEDVRKDHEKEVARLKADHEASIEAHRETHVHEDEVVHLRAQLMQAQEGEEAAERRSKALERDLDRNIARMQRQMKITNEEELQRLHRQVAALKDELRDEASKHSTELVELKAFHNKELDIAKSLLEATTSGQISQLRQQNELLQNQVEDGLATVSSSRAQLSASAKEAERLHAEKIALEATLILSNTEIEGLNQGKGTLVEREKKLKADVAAMIQAKEIAADTHQQELDEARASVDAAQQSLKSIKEKMAAAQSRSSARIWKSTVAFKKRENELQHEIKALKEASTNNEAVASLAHKKMTEELLASHELAKNELESAMNRLRLELDSAERRNTSASASMRAQVAEMAVRRDQEDELKEQIAGLETEREETTGLAAHLQHQLDEVLRERTIASEEMRAQAVTITASENAENELLRKMKMLEVEKSRVEEAMARMSTMLVSANNRVDGLEQRMTTARGQSSMRAWKNTVAFKNHERELLEKLKALEEEKAAIVQQASNSAEAGIQEMEEAKTELNALIAGLKKELDAVQLQADVESVDLKKKIVTLQGESRELKDKIATLKVEITTLKEESAVANKDPSISMDELRVQLETDHTAAMEALRAENAVDLDALRALHTETSEQITLKHSEKAAEDDAKAHAAHQEVIGLQEKLKMAKTIASAKMWRSTVTFKKRENELQEKIDALEREKKTIIEGMMKAREATTIDHEMIRSELEGVNSNLMVQLEERQEEVERIKGERDELKLRLDEEKARSDELRSNETKLQSANESSLAAYSEALKSEHALAMHELETRLEAEKAALRAGLLAENKELEDGLSELEAEKKELEDALEQADESLKSMGQELDELADANQEGIRREEDLEKELAQAGEQIEDAQNSTLEQIDQLEETFARQKAALEEELAQRLAQRVSGTLAQGEAALAAAKASRAAVEAQLRNRIALIEAELAATQTAFDEMEVDNEARISKYIHQVSELESDKERLQMDSDRMMEEIEAMASDAESVLAERTRQMDTANANARAEKEKFEEKITKLEVIVRQEGLRVEQLEAQLDESRMMKLKQEKSLQKLGARMWKGTVNFRKRETTMAERYERERLHAKQEADHAAEEHAAYEREHERLLTQQRLLEAERQKVEQEHAAYESEHAKVKKEHAAFERQKEIAEREHAQVLIERERLSREKAGLVSRMAKMSTKVGESSAAQNKEIARLEVETKRLEIEMQRIEGKFQKKASEVQQLKEGHAKMSARVWSMTKEFKKRRSSNEQQEIDAKRKLDAMAETMRKTKKKMHIAEANARHKKKVLKRKSITAEKARATEETRSIDEAATAAATSSEAADVLPAGWIAVLDPSSGSSYYYHEGKQITQWKKPAVEDDSNGDADVGWDIIIDPATSYPYYVNKATNAVQWEMPPEISNQESGAGKEAKVVSHEWLAMKQTNLNDVDDALSDIRRSLKFQGRKMICSHDGCTSEATHGDPGTGLSEFCDQHHKDHHRKIKLEFGSARGAWVELIDKERRTVYYNTATDVLQIERPRGWVKMMAENFSSKTRIANNFKNEAHNRRFSFTK